MTRSRLRLSAVLSKAWTWWTSSTPSMANRLAAASGPVNKARSSKAATLISSATFPASTTSSEPRLLNAKKGVVIYDLGARAPAWQSSWMRALPLLRVNDQPSEAVIQAELQHATAEEGVGDLAELSRSDILIAKGPDRMIEDVRGVHAKHQFLPLSDLGCLTHREVHTEHPGGG